MCVIWRPNCKDCAGGQLTLGLVAVSLTVMMAWSQCHRPMFGNLEAVRCPSAVLAILCSTLLLLPVMERQLPNLFAHGASPFTKAPQNAHTQDMADFYMVCMEAMSVSESTARNMALEITDTRDSADQFCCKCLEGMFFVSDIC